jgi:hypothetical protein
VRGPEGVISVNITEFRKLPREILLRLLQRRVVLGLFVLYFLLLIEPHVLKKQALAAHKLLRLLLCLSADAVIYKNNRPAH